MSDSAQEKCLGCSKDFHINEIQAHVRQNQECRKKYDKWSFNKLSPQEKCLGCSRNFPINGIQTHLRQKQECRKKYSQDEFNKLKQLCEAEVKKKLLYSKSPNEFGLKASIEKPMFTSETMFGMLERLSNHWNSNPFETETRV